MWKGGRRGGSRIECRIRLIPGGVSGGSGEKDRAGIEEVQAIGLSRLRSKQFAEQYKYKRGLL